MALLARGVNQTEVARQREVSTPTALRLRRALEAEGKETWRRRPLGQPPKIQETHREAVCDCLTEAAHAHGFTNDLGTRPRVAAVCFSRGPACASTPDICGGCGSNRVRVCRGRRSAPPSGTGRQSPGGSATRGPL